MRFGLLVQMTGVLGYPQPLARLARAAEAAGWDGFFIWDVFGGASAAPSPVVDPWIALAAIAATTERIRFGTMVTPLPRRRPWKLAREAASLDHLSGGRLILGDLRKINEPQAMLYSRQSAAGGRPMKLTDS